VNPDPRRVSEDADPAKSSRDEIEVKRSAREYSHVKGAKTGGTACTSGAGAQSTQVKRNADL